MTPLIEGKSAVVRGSVRLSAKPSSIAAERPKTSGRPANGNGKRSDPVSLILSQWQRERPDLDPAPMQMFGLIARAQMLLDSYFNDVLKKWKLSRGSFDVLAALRRSGPPYSLTPKQLSNSLMLSGAGMTSRLDRLESSKLIIRLPEPNDRRSLKIQLTPRGVRLIDQIVPVIVEAQWKVASALGKAETNRLTLSLRALSDVLASSGH